MKEQIHTNNAQYAIEMRNITKVFPGIIANDNITLQVREGEIHALLGENGAGKSTLMSVLFGMYQPEHGKIFIRGEEVRIKDPNDANRYKIGIGQSEMSTTSSEEEAQMRMEGVGVLFRVVKAAL